MSILVIMDTELLELTVNKFLAEHKIRTALDVAQQVLMMHSESKDMAKVERFIESFILHLVSALDFSSFPEKKLELLLKKVSKLFGNFPERTSSWQLGLYMAVAARLKKQKKFKISKQLLTDALGIADASQKSRIYLNLSSVFNSMKDSTSALAFAKRACQQSQEDFIQSKISGLELSEIKSRLALSYFNLGIQYESLRKEKAAGIWYAKAKKAIETHIKIPEIATQTLHPRRPQTAKNINIGRSRLQHSTSRPVSAFKIKKSKRKTRPPTIGRKTIEDALQSFVYSPIEKPVADIEEVKGITFEVNIDEIFGKNAHGQNTEITHKADKLIDEKQDIGMPEVKNEKLKDKQPGIVYERNKGSASSDEEDKFTIVSKNSNKTSNGSSNSASDNEDDPEILHNGKDTKREKEHNKSESDLKQNQFNFYNSYDILKIISIQAYYRGYHLRKRLPKNALKPKLVFQKAMMINRDTMVSSVYSLGDKRIIKLKNDLCEHKLVIDKNEDYLDTLSRLTIKNGRLVMKKQEHGMNLLTKTDAEVSGRDVTLKVFHDVDNLLVKVKTPEGNLYYGDKIPNIPEHKYKKYVDNSVIPYLQIEKGTVKLNRIIKTTKKLLRTASAILEGMRSTIKIYKVKDTYSRIQIEANDLVAQLDMDYIRSLLNLDTTKEFFTNPAPLFLAISIRNLTIELSKIGRTDHEFLCKKVMNMINYTIKIFTFEGEKDRMILIEAFKENAPLVEGILESETAIQKMVSYTRHNYTEIIKRLSIFDGKLTLQNKILDLFQAVLRIQRHFRMRKQREDYYLQMQKRKRAEVKSLLQRKAVVVSETPYIISIYSVDQKYLIEATDQSSSQKYYKVLESIQNNVFQNLSERNGQLFLNDSEFNTILNDNPAEVQYLAAVNRTSNTVIHGQEYTVIIQGLKNQGCKVALMSTIGSETLMRVFTAQEISDNGLSLDSLSDSISIFDNNIILKCKKRRTTQEQNQFNVLIRTSKIIQSKVYTIIMKIQSANDKYQPSDMLLFEARQGSNLLTNQKIQISLADACECSGFRIDYIIPMGFYIIKNFLVISPSTIAFDFSIPPCDIEATVVKIQAHIKGFLARKYLEPSLKPKKVYASRTKIQGVKYTLCIYEQETTVSVIAVRGETILSLCLNASIVKDYLVSDFSIKKNIISYLSVSWNKGVQTLSISYSSFIERSQSGFNRSITAILNKRTRSKKSTDLDKKYKE